MKCCSIIVLRLTIVVAGIAILALCFGGTWLVSMMWDSNPTRHIIKIAMLGGLYLTAIPFFVALYQTMKLLGYINSGCAFSQLSIKALKKIQLCAIATVIACTVGGLPFFCYWANIDDAPGLILIGIAIDGGAFVTAILASIIKRLLQDAIDVKSENDLTI